MTLGVLLVLGVLSLQIKRLGYSWIGGDTNMKPVVVTVFLLFFV